MENEMSTKNITIQHMAADGKTLETLHPATNPGQVQGLEDILAGLSAVKGSDDPTDTTAGAVGQLYLNTSTGMVFICKSADGTSYTWDSMGSTPVYPQIIISVDSGAVVSCTNGADTRTAVSNGTVIFNVPDYGDWTVQAELSGQLSNIEIIKVNTVKQYPAELSFFDADLTVTAEADAAVTVSRGAHTYTDTCGADGKCVFKITAPGSYTVTAFKNGAVSSSAAADISESGKSYTSTVAFIVLTVTVDSGSEVSVNDGTTTLSGTSSGTAVFYLPNIGVWNVTASLSGESASGSIDITDYQDYAVTLGYAKVIGVEWDYTNPSTALARLTEENDPKGVVTRSIMTEPQPAVGTGSGSSPFDELMPWSGMDEFNVIDNELSHRRGEPNFSRTEFDTVVRIPKFWYMVEKDTASSKMRFYIADTSVPGFSVHPAFNRGDGERPYIYVGKYSTGSGYVTMSGLAPLNNITRGEARTGSSDKGAPWWQYDYATWSAIWLLYLVEFADWDSQARIGSGIVSGSPASTGGCDAMSYHTGRTAGAVGSTTVTYRWIENLWGNIYEWCDGFNADGGLNYICLNPAQFADDTTINYTSTGITLTSVSGMIKGIGFSDDFAFAFLPTGIGGSTTTYIPDYFEISSGWCVSFVGGYITGRVGLFSFGSAHGKTYSHSRVGTRLLFLP